MTEASWIKTVLFNEKEKLKLCGYKFLAVSAEVHEDTDRYVEALGTLLALSAPAQGSPQPAQDPLSSPSGAASPVPVRH